MHALAHLKTDNAKKKSDSVDQLLKNNILWSIWHTKLKILSSHFRCWNLRWNHLYVSCDKSCAFSFLIVLHYLLHGDSITCSCLSNWWHIYCLTRWRKQIGCGDFGGVFCSCVIYCFNWHFFWEQKNTKIKINTHTHFQILSENKELSLTEKQSMKNFWPFWFSQAALTLAGSFAHIGISFLVEESMHFECSTSHVVPSEQQCILSAQHTACSHGK